MSLDGAPFFVADDERLIRECSSGNIKNNGAVKPRAFVSTQDPLEISVHRDAYCVAGSECGRDRYKAAVMVIAGEARQLKTQPIVKSDQPADDHALICIVDTPTVKTKDELSIEANAAAFKKHDALCRELAAIAVPVQRLTPSGLLS
jgi:hypothetical protein